MNITNDHHCHWPGCTKKVRPALWGCRTHWYKLPTHLRAQLWEVYVIGQEITKTPSAAYLEVAQKVQDWIKNQK